MTNLDDKMTPGSTLKTVRSGDARAMRKRVQKKADGRTIIFYSFEDDSSAGKPSEMQVDKKSVEIKPGE